MFQLSQFQTGIFHISPAYTEISPERFKDDRFIDGDQIDEFVKASEVKIYLPADQGDYPYTLVDYFTLDSDLMGSNRFYSVLYAYPPYLHLSRHNVSRTEYTDEKLPPPVYITAVKAHEPIYNQRVEALSMQLTENYVQQDEYFIRSVSPGEEDVYSGHFYNGQVWSWGHIAVWLHDFPRQKETETANGIPRLPD